jgi:cell division transport system permease protein
MFTVFSRIIHYGLKNFWRNGWPSAATVAIMIVALFTFFGLIMFNVVTTEARNSIQDKIDVSVYFKTNVVEDDILNIKQSLETLPEIKSPVEYISRDRALEIFAERHANDPVITQTVRELNVNPLEASLNIKARNPEDYPKIAEYLKAPDFAEKFDTITYFQNQQVIDKLIRVIRIMNQGGLLLTILLAFVAGLVVFNTIQLAIYSSRDEIVIMRAVGASNNLVRGPFVVEGMLSGVIAAVASLMLAAPLVYFIAPYLSNFIPGLDIFKYFYTNLFALLLYQVLFGIAIGSFSSFIAVRRYLRN